MPRLSGSMDYKGDENERKKMNECGEFTIIRQKMYNTLLDLWFIIYNNICIIIVTVYIFNE